MDKKEIGQRLRKARDDKGFSQVQVMEHTNINNKTLSGYENGVSEPDLDTLTTLANLYEVSIDDLVGRNTPPLETFIRNWFNSLPPDIQNFIKDKDSKPWLILAKDMKEQGIPIESIKNVLTGFAEAIRDLKSIGTVLDEKLIRHLSEKDDK